MRVALRCRNWGAARLTVVAGVMIASPVLAEVELGPRDPVSIVLFGSLETGPTKTFASTGLKRAIAGGLDASGFRVLAKIGGAIEPANRAPPRGTAYKSEAQLLLGYEWRLGDSFVALYAGPDQESEQRDATRNPIIRHRFGARLQAELWATPGERIMLQASAYAATLDRRFWGRLAAGWSIAPELYLGPEIEAYQQSRYSKLRLGLHLTGIRLFGLSWRISGGWQNTSDRPSETYVTLGAQWRR